MYSALVLAGGESFCADKSGVPIPEALLDIAGQPMLAYVIAALKDSRTIGEIVVAGKECLPKLCPVQNVKFVPGGASMLDTLKIGVYAAGMPEKIVLITADIPLINGAIIDDFIYSCEQADADFYYPIVAKQRIQQLFPHSKRTYFRLCEGVFTGGNIFLARTAILPFCQTAGQKIISNRKKPWRLAAMLGWGNLLAFICGRMSIAQAQLAASSILGIKACVLNTAAAQIAMDVDKLSDLISIREYYKKNKQGYDDN